ncbi:MAG: DUF1499 domain-containing protein [Pseudomonadota bacterium]
MRLFTTLLVLVVFAIVALAAYVRLAPSDPATWHTDPGAATPGMGRYVVRPEGGDSAGPLVPLSPAEALAAFDAIVRATPRTEVLAGSVEEGRITYVTRSRLWGFPDYTTVAAEADGTGARLVLHARLRFGQSDMGVNAARVEAWLDLLPR